MPLKLKPTARLKRRYLLVTGSRATCEHALLDYLGLLGWSRAAPVFLTVDEKRSIIAVNRSEVTHVRAGLALAADELTVNRVSGTLAGLGIKLSPRLRELN